MSSTATAARSSPAPSPSAGGPAATNTSSGRRRLPPAEIVAPACSPSTGPCEAATSARRASSRSSIPGTCAPPGLDDGGDRLGGGHQRDRPVMQRDDPSRGQDPADVGEAGAGERAAERLRAGEALHRLRQVRVGLGVCGEASERRHDAIEPDREERRQRRPRRRRDLEHDDAPARAARRAPSRPARARGRRSCGRRSRPSRRRTRRRRRAARARCPTPSGCPARRRPSCAPARASPPRSPSRPPRRPAARAGRARAPGRRCRSRRRARASPGPTCARSAARSRQRWCRPAVMTEFMTS